MWDLPPLPVAFLPWVNGGSVYLFVRRRLHREIARVHVRQGDGADLDATSTSTNIGTTAMKFAAGRGHVDVVRYLAELGADPNAATNEHRITAMMMATMNGHVEAIRALAEIGVDPNTTDLRGITAMVIAAWKGHLDAIGAGCGPERRRHQRHDSARLGA